MKTRECLSLRETADSTRQPSAPAPVDNGSYKGLTTAVSGGSAALTGGMSGAVYSVQGSYGSQYCVVAYYTYQSGSSTGNVQPHITSLSPAQDPVGATYTVIINGTGFGSSPKSNDSVSAGNGVVVTIDPSSTNTSIKAYFLMQTSATAGNHSVTVTASSQTSNSVNFFVQVPTVAVIYSDTGTSENTCPLAGGGTGCGSGRSIIWQFKDQRNPPQPINAALNIYDTMAIGSQNDFNATLSQFTTTCPNNTGPCGVYTNSSGIAQNPDINAFCSPNCISNGACVNPSLKTVVTQTWHANSIAVQQHIYTFMCGDVQIDGHD